MGKKDCVGCGRFDGPGYLDNVAESVVGKIGVNSRILLLGPSNCPVNYCATVIGAMEGSSTVDTQSNGNPYNYIFDIRDICLKYNEV